MCVQYCIASVYVNDKPDVLNGSHKLVQVKTDAADSWKHISQMNLYWVINFEQNISRFDL